MSRGFYRVAVTMIAVTGSAWAQKAPVRQLTAPAAEYAEPFTQVIGVRALKDGRVLVLDMQERTIQMVSPDFSSATPVGRQGRGPGEYANPIQLIPGRADTTIVYDAGALRLLIIDSQGKPGESISLASTAAGAFALPASVRGVDPQGRVVYQTLGMKLTSAGPQMADTAAIVRRSLAAPKLDTLAYVRTGSPGMKMSGDAKAGVKVSSTMPAFKTVDEWGVLPDGRVVIVRGADYHVEWVTSLTAHTSAVPIAFERVKVTDADKAKLREDARKAQKQAEKAIASARANVPNAAQAKMPQFTIEDPDEWPTVKPPFTNNGMLVAPDGKLWVGRLLPVSEKGALYDVIDASGKVVQRVALPAKTRIVGFGRGVVYTVRIDEDDLEYLQKYKY